MLPRVSSPSKKLGSDTEVPDGHSSESSLSATCCGRSQHTKDLTDRPRPDTAAALNDQSCNAASIGAHLRGVDDAVGTATTPVMMKSFRHNEVGALAKHLSPTRKQLLLPKENRRHRRDILRQRRTESENDIFTTFTLNRDLEKSKYVPYDEVVYPKLFNRPAVAWRPSLHPMAPMRGESFEDTGKYSFSRLAPAVELDSMWIVGFVEDSHRHRKDTLSRELGDFVRLPGSTVLPVAPTKIKAISQVNTPTSFNLLSSVASKMRHKVSSMRVRTGSSRKGGSRGMNADDRFEDGVEKARSSRGKSALSPLERLRLDELEKKLTQASLGVRDHDERRKAGLRAYASVNRKLRKILSGARPPVAGPSLKSEGLETMLRRSREELSAAVRIQRFYKLYYRRNKFAKMIQHLHGVIRIQALVRGVIARRYVAKTRSRRSAMVLAWQKRIRRMLSNIKWRRRLVVENRAASRIQVVARGRAGRVEARRVRANLAALRIQCLWRGSVDRAKADRLWLDALAIRMQGLARMMVAKRKVEHTRRIHNGAARTIQRCFRGAVARRAMASMIWEQNMERRLNFLRGLAAEEDWETENLEIAKRTYERARLDERLEEALAAESAAHAAVFELENNEQHLKSQRMMLSPRALEQGWKEEFDSNIAQHREWITKRKLEAVFEKALPARKLEEEVKQRDEELANRNRRAMQLAHWRDEELREIFDREARRRFDGQHLVERRKVADEKRKWAVSHVTLSGKPDKTKARRRSRPWEAFQDPVEGALKQVFTGGSVDLFAGERSSVEALREVSTSDASADVFGGEQQGSLSTKNGTLEQVLARLKLQAHVNQVAQLEELMRPAEDIVLTLGLKPLLERQRVHRVDRAASPTTPPAESSLGRLPASPLPQSQAPTFYGGHAKKDPTFIPDYKGHQTSVSLEPSCATDTSWQGLPRKSTRRGDGERASAARFLDRYGAAASTSRERPPAVGAGEAPVPIEWGEEERVRARQRQRRLHMLASHDRPTTPTVLSSAGSSSSCCTSRVPWQLLDELEAEKSKLRPHKI